MRLPDSRHYIKSLKAYCFSIILFLLFTFSSSINLQAQNEGQDLIDSLLSELPKAKEDTNKVNLLNKISFAYYTIKPSQGIIYAEKGIALAEKLHFKTGLAASFNACAANFALLPDVPKAAEYFLKALAIHESLGDKITMAKILRNIGTMYSDEANYPKALEYLSKAIRINEVLGDKRSLARNLGSIGIAYYDQSNYPKALEYHLKSLMINEALKDKSAIGKNYTNIGNVYYKQNNYPKAFEYYAKSLSIAEASGNKDATAKSLVNIAIAYQKQTDYPKALEHYAKAADLFEKTDNKSGLARAISNSGSVYENLENYTKAMEYYLKALGMSREMNDADGIALNIECLGKIYLKMAKDSNVKPNVKNEYIAKAISNFDSAAKLYQSISALDEYHVTMADLSEAYELNMEYDKALIAFKESTLYKDSVFNEEKSNEITRKEMDYTYAKREDSTRLETDKKELQLKKEIALKALQFEYEKKQAAAKSDEERKQLKYEQQIKEQQISDEYSKKIALADAKQQHEQALNKVLAKENTLMQQNSKNESRVRWLMITALIGFTAFGVNYYRSYQKQKAANTKILKQSDELKTLMQEVHHRVKNNLQLISSLLELQGMRLTDDAAKSAFEEGQSRVQSIAILHHQLYQHEDLHTIELNTFVAELLRQISIVFKKQGQDVMIENLIPETFFDIDVALPLGLILNELATNTFKYANPSIDNEQIQKLLIEIKLMKDSDNVFTLIYKDNGTGLSKTFDLNKAKSLGLRIVNRLSKQLKGTCVYEYDKGAKFSIQFAQKRA